MSIAARARAIAARWSSEGEACRTVAAVAASQASATPSVPGEPPLPICRTVATASQNAPQAPAPCNATAFARSVALSQLSQASSDALHRIEDDWAAALDAIEQAERPPRFLSRPDWARERSAVIAWTMQHARDLAAAGWTPEEVLGLDYPNGWFRFDGRGAAWLLNHGKVTLISRDAIRIETQNGAAQTFRRRLH